MMRTWTRSVAVGMVWALGLATPAWSQKADAGVQEDLRHARALSRTFNRAATVVGPSVVHITPISRVAFRRGWFEPVETEMRPTGAGSGVVVSAEGYIVTNNHVIESAERVQVKFADGRMMEGTIVGRDPATDLGVVRVKGEGLKPATWGDSDALEVGDWVIAVGSPFGQFDNTVTAGIVSAKNRTGLASASDERFEDFIQTDAAINPGNSGGPLVDLEGKVVGINSQIATRGGGSVGIGFSIPASIARAVADSIIRTGRAQRGWLGVQMAGPAQAAPGEGVAIADVVRGGPAEEAGIRPGDVVVRYNGREVGNGTRLRNAIAFTTPGSEATLDLVRDGKARTVRVSVLDRDEAITLSAGGAAYKRFGFIVSDLTPQVLAQLGYRGELEGVVVARIDPLGPATGANGLQAGDIIVQANRTPTPSTEAFDSVVKGFGGQRLRLGVIRGPQQGYIEISARK